MKAKRLVGSLYCLVLGAFLSTSALAADLLCDDFDAYATGAPPVPPWVESYQGPGSTPLVYTRGEAAAHGVTIHVQDTVSFGLGKSVHFLDTSGSLSIDSQLSRGFTSTSHVVSEFYMRTHNGEYEGAFVRLIGDAGADYAISFGAPAGGGQAGYIGLLALGAWDITDLLPYIEDTWYYVRRELDCTTDTGSFYDEELLDPVAHPLGDPSNNSAAVLRGSDVFPNSYIDSILLFTSNSQGADCYIDELCITPEPATLALLAIGGMALLRRKRGYGG